MATSPCGSRNTGRARWEFGTAAACEKKRPSRRGRGGGAVLCWTNRPRLQRGYVCEMTTMPSLILPFTIPTLCCLSSVASSQFCYIGDFFTAKSQTFCSRTRKKLQTLKKNEDLIRIPRCICSIHQKNCQTKKTRDGHFHNICAFIKFHEKMIFFVVDGTNDKSSFRKNELVRT
jgi:hypothetical protein